ncbi:MAG: hypothetical protein KBC41_04305 [Candidatus Pacebacteria bacterium]|nr:hypothetical protein [Candidatus Paceibacterota bacterium]MBP9867266.1 hypothetical protein [Candidatus Paceibacterota bacterium]
MEKPFAPLSGVIEGVCVDNVDTKVHEDLFRITKKKGNIQIDLVAIIPPEITISRGKLQRELLKPYLSSQKYPTGFIEKFLRRDLGFDTKKPKMCLVATYVLDEKDTLIFEEISIAQAIGKIMTYEDYTKQIECKSDNTVFLKLLRKKRTVKAKVYSTFSHRNTPTLSLGEKNIFIANELFNHTCRRAATHVGLHFIKELHKYSQEENRKFLLRSPEAKFNCSLRDPCAFINMSILVDYLLDVPQIFTLPYLKTKITIEHLCSPK